MFYSHARAMSNIFYWGAASLIDHESAGKGAEDFLSRYVDVWMLNDLECCAIETVEAQISATAERDLGMRLARLNRVS